MQIRLVGVQHLLTQYGNIKKILIDGANPGFIRLLYGDLYPEYAIQLRPEEIDRTVIELFIPSYNTLFLDNYPDVFAFFTR